MNANFVSKLTFRGGASGRTRTYNPSVNRCDPSFFLWQNSQFFLLYMCDDFEAGRGKNPNFNEMKREGGKRSIGRFKLDYCRNRGINGTDKGIFAGFKH